MWRADGYIRMASHSVEILCAAADVGQCHNPPLALQKDIEGISPPGRTRTRGRGRLLPVQRLGGMTDAASGVHRGRWVGGGMAARDAGAAAPGFRASRRCVVFK